MKQWICDKCGCPTILEESTNVNQRRWLFVTDGSLDISPEEDDEVFGTTEYRCSRCNDHIADTYEGLLEYLEKGESK